MTKSVPAWIAERIPAYLEGRRNDLGALRRALEANDLVRIIDLAHKMKGTGSSYGFGEITEIGGRMQAAAKTGKRRDIEASISALEECLNGVEKRRGDSRECGTSISDSADGSQRLRH